MRETKQVLVIRKDLKMSCGKACAQVAHASMAVFTQQAHFTVDPFFHNNILHSIINKPMKEWLESSFTKVCVCVDNEQELLHLQWIANTANIPNALIEDNGLTTFKGVKTKTVLAIGPHWSDELDKITGNLKLY